MSTVHYIVQIDINGETYDTSLIMKTESLNDVEAFKIPVVNETVHFLHITKTDNKYDGYTINKVQPIVKPVIQLDKDLREDEILALKQINYTFSKEIILDAKKYIEGIIKGGKINIDYNYFNNIIQEYIEKRENAKNVFNTNKNPDSYYDWLNAAQEAFTICIFNTKVYLMYLILVDIAINREQNVTKNKLKDTLSYLLTPDTDTLIQIVSDNITNAANELADAENAYILNNNGIKANNAATEAGNTITEVKTIITKVKK
jgi:hypothetical protein